MHISVIIIMWSNWSESAKASLTQALEKTGGAISKAATQAGKASQQRTAANANEEEIGDDDSANKAKGRYSDEGGRQQKQQLAEKSQELLGNLQAGWSSVVKNTKASIKTAQEEVEKQQHRLQERLNEVRVKYYKRDPSLPLDVVALKDASVVYITDRIITCSHPAMPSTVNGEITAERKLAAVGHLLQRRHNGRFMVWNISEVEYETRILDEQVLTFSFPGSPSPPLGLLLKVLISMEAWLKADDRNVALVHCLTGKGRTSTVLAAFLCWMGQAGFADIYQALDYIAACKQMTTLELTIPSQRRYTAYFKNMLDGVRPSQPPLMLKRIIMSHAPAYARGPPLRGDKKAGQKEDADADDSQRLGCAPYLQLFKAGQLLHTAPASLHFQQAPDELPFCQVADGSVSFVLEVVVQGDLLVRCRHLTSTKKRLSMFRAALHTGYVPPKVLRLQKSELDGACNDERFPDDFFLDLIFEAVDAEEASKLLLQEQGEQQQHASQEGGPDTPPAAVTSTGQSAAAQTLAGGGTTVTASTYDSMLHRDSRFWDVIAARRQEQAQAAAPAGATQQQDGGVAPDLSMWGPTVGRRRDFDKKKKNAAESDADKASSQQKTALETFSIGGELDFLPEDEPKPAEPAQPPPPKPRDSLMEALMGALNEDEDAEKEHSETEVVIFESDAKADEATSNEPVPPAVASSSPVAAAVATDEPGDTAAEAHGSLGTPVAPKKEPEPATSDQAETRPAKDDAVGDDDVANLLADANLELDDDMDALLAEAGDTGDFDADLLDFDDTELEDLENFLSPSK